MNTTPTMTAEAAIAIFDKSAERTRPNAQTAAWAALRAHLTALEARCEALQADAERYVWMRAALMGNSDAPLDAFTDQPEPATTDEFDAAIDRARGMQDE